MGGSMKVVVAVLCAALAASSTAWADEGAIQGIDIIAEMDATTILRDLNDATAGDLRRALKRIDIASSFAVGDASVTVHVEDAARLAQAGALIAAIQSEPYLRIYTVTMTADGVLLTLTDAYKAKLLNDVSERALTIIAHQLGVPRTAVWRGGSRLRVHLEGVRDYRPALLELNPPKVGFAGRWTLPMTAHCPTDSSDCRSYA